MFSLCCRNVEEVVIPERLSSDSRTVVATETPAEATLRLAKEEIGKLSIAYAKLVGRKFGLEPVFPSLKDIDLPAATAMVTSLKEKIETITAELSPGLVLRTPMSPENRAEILRLRAEYEALDPYPCVCPYGPIDDMDQQSAISHLSTLRIWISARKTMKEHMAMSPEDKAEILRLRAEYDSLLTDPSVVPFGSIDHMNTNSAKTHITNLRMMVFDLKARKECATTRINAQMSASNTRYSMDMTRGGGGSMSDWVGSDGHTLPGFPGPPREYTEAKLAQTRT